MHYFNRQFSLESFVRLVGEEIFSRLRPFLPRMRKRLIGLEGFVWLGLFVAANTALGSLAEILGLAVGECGGVLPPKLVSVSAFCQYRARFPPQDSFEALAPAGGEVRGLRRQACSFVARTQSVCHRCKHSYSA